MIEEIRQLFPGVGKELIEVYFRLAFSKGLIKDALNQLFLFALEN
jgi:hypothetical protein